MFEPIGFFVPGHPACAGSKKYVHHNGRIKLVDDCSRNRTWRHAVQVHAVRAYSSDLLVEPVRLSLDFVFLRPGSHYYKRKSGRVLRDDAPEFPDVTPDLTKLVRAIEDALTGVVWRDDCRVVQQVNCKSYGAIQGAHVLIEPAIRASTGGPELSNLGRPSHV